MKTREELLAYYKTYNKNRRKKCLDCGATISHEGVRCRSCGIKKMWENPGMKNRNFATGERHGHWKGGYRTTLGYVLILKRGHPRADKAGYVREHILVWEQANGKPLPDGWIVHHLNGIRDDNRPSNLAGLPSKKHFHLLMAKAKRIQELEALLKKQGQLL